MSEACTCTHTCSMTNMEGICCERLLHDVTRCIGCRIQLGQQIKHDYTLKKQKQTQNTPVLTDQCVTAYTGAALHQNQFRSVQQ